MKKLGFWGCLGNWSLVCPSRCFLIQRAFEGGWGFMLRLETMTVPFVKDAFCFVLLGKMDKNHETTQPGEVFQAQFLTFPKHDSSKPKHQTTVFKGKPNDHLIHPFLSPLLHFQEGPPGRGSLDHSLRLGCAMCATAAAAPLATSGTAGRTL